MKFAILHLYTYARVTLALGLQYYLYPRLYEFVLIQSANISLDASEPVLTSVEMVFSYQNRLKIYRRMVIYSVVSLVSRELDLCLGSLGLISRLDQPTNQS